MSSWMVEGRRKETIDDETQYCDQEILTAILKNKTIFDRLEDKELRKARTKCNPFETIRGKDYFNLKSVASL